MTNKSVVIINSLKVPQIKKILLYEMKFLVPNYSCLQNPWLGGYQPQITVLSVLNWICWTPTNKIPGYATAPAEDPRLLACDAVSLGEQFPTFHKITMFLSLRSCSPLNAKMKALWFFKMLGSTHPATQHHNPENMNPLTLFTKLQPPPPIFWTMWIWEQHNQIHTELQSEVIWTNTWQCCSRLCTVAIRCAFSTYKSFTRMSARARRSICVKIKHSITTTSHNNLSTYLLDSLDCSLFHINRIKLSLLYLAEYTVRFIP
jgi:hypothetical protein